ncbi:MAG: valine--tRNA ligase [Minisyncoccia bacterium]|jgi:valyl-tRNA synthetase
MEPRYDIKEVESRIAAAWERSGYFNPDVCVEKGVTAADAEPFSIILPPPNVTGELHMGHAAMLVIEDILVRWNRMRGKRTLWVPGTDHAAIATQSRVEKMIAKEEKKSRYDLGREEFLRRVHEYAKKSHDTIVKQVKRMGASLDWSRETYTLDATRERAVRAAFQKMYETGLIYRGDRIVNWDPQLQTTVSDDEVEWIEETAPFYYLKYGPFTIATARPETKFGDKYVVMHPDDKRYEKYQHGAMIDLEWINGPVKATIVKDPSIDMAFGTGVMTITPWHDTTDFEIAERHHLDTEQIIDLNGKLLPIAGEFAGMHIKKARPLIVQKLKKKGLIEKVDEHYAHRVATNNRGGGIIEPQILKQWFVAVERKFKAADGEEKTPKELMREAVASGAVKITPDRFGKIYFNWIDHLHDWCISRQIWFGHRIPVWYKGEEVYVGTEPPRGDKWTQDPDTLDTWFSSGLWPFSVFGWPDKTKDLKTYFPNSLLETGYDILFFWVARMILMSTCLMGTVPFREVYLHGLVRDAKGRKMSKSLGNGIDPLAMAEKYGADATRLSLVIGASAGSDIKLSEDRIRGYRNFSTKIWNIARFINMNKPAEGAPVDPEKFTIERRMEIEALDALKTEVTAHLEAFEFHLAAEKLYHYIWHTLADKIVEAEKIALRDGDAAQKAGSYALLEYLLLASLKMLHPFMPFVTEEIYGIFRPGTMLMVEAWRGDGMVK